MGAMQGMRWRSALLRGVKSARLKKIPWRSTRRRKKGPLDRRSEQLWLWRVPSCLKSGFCVCLAAVAAATAAPKRQGNER
jgi:hypothetical protein